MRIKLGNNDVLQEKADCKVVLCRHQWWIINPQLTYPVFFLQSLPPFLPSLVLQLQHNLQLLCLTQLGLWPLRWTQEEVLGEWERLKHHFLCSSSITHLNPLSFLGDMRKVVHPRSLQFRQLRDSLQGIQMIPNYMKTTSNMRSTQYFLNSTPKK